VRAVVVAFLVDVQEPVAVVGVDGQLRGPAAARNDPKNTGQWSLPRLDTTVACQSCVSTLEAM
jgi:hypothetical protein